VARLVRPASESDCFGIAACRFAGVRNEVTLKDVLSGVERRGTYTAERMPENGQQRSDERSHNQSMLKAKKTLQADFANAKHFFIQVSTLLGLACWDRHERQRPHSWFRHFRAVVTSGKHKDETP